MRREGESHPERRPGQVIWLEAGDSWLNRDKGRPFAVAAAPVVPQTATLAYGSSSEAEKAVGGATIRVAPRRWGVNRNGLDVPTHFYPGILLRHDYADLRRHAGTLGKSLEEFRSALRVALGIGQGSARSAGAPTGSRRGRIVILERRIASGMQSRLAVTLTEHGYSRADHYHLVLPLIRGEGRETSSSVVRLETRAWMKVFADPPASVLVPVPVVQSIWYRKDVARETEHVMDEDSLARIDRALCDYFALPDPPPSG